MGFLQRSTTAIILFLLLVCSPAQAQTHSAPIEEQAEKTESTITVRTRDRYNFESDVNRQSGQVTVNQADFSMTYDGKAFEKMPVTAWIDYRHTDIVESVPVDLPSRLEFLRLGLGAKFPIPFVNTGEHFMGVDVMPSMYTDNGEWTTSALRVPFRTYLIYKPENEKSFLAIFGVQVDVNADTPIIPIIGFDYRPDDRWFIHLATTEPTISYKVTDNWQVFGEYDGTLVEYEVEHNGQEGVNLKMREVFFGGGVKYLIAEWFEASVSSGMNTSRRFEYRDNTGKVDVDAGPYVRARLSMTF